MWYLEAKTPVECYARSIDKVLGPLYQGIDATAGMIMMSDGTIYHLNISWALPVTWPGAVYSLEVGITGTDGVLTIDDTHRDMVLAVSKPQSEGYAPDQTRLVDFLGSYPPGDMALGELRGPMADETVSWLNRVALGLPTPAATVEEAHKNLMLTKALDLSAKRKQPVQLPLEVTPLSASGIQPSAGWPSWARSSRSQRLTQAPAILSSCATSGGASGTPSRMRSSRHWRRRSPGMRISSTPGSRFDSFSSRYAGRPRPCSHRAAGSAPRPARR
jgi:hypothetical protein